MSLLRIKIYSNKIIYYLSKKYFKVQILNQIKIK